MYGSKILKLPSGKSRINANKTQKSKELHIFIAGNHMVDMFCNPESERDQQMIKNVENLNRSIIKNQPNA